MKNAETPGIREAELPAARDKHGHLTQYPGRVCYVHDEWRLVYLGSPNGGHEFWAERFERLPLGRISFEQARSEVRRLAAMEPKP